MKHRMYLSSRSMAYAKMIQMITVDPYASDQAAILLHTELVSQSIRHVLINGAVVCGEEPPQYWTKGEAHAFWAAWAAEEERYSGVSQ